MRDKKLDGVNPDKAAQTLRRKISPGHSSAVSKKYRPQLCIRRAAVI
ncbi:MAG TPA: hypothetical protein VEV17_14390 [Bryobacteraceae bacterium]|nr:hypothetical protein [Bryobacteraceae bacterium]